MKVIHILSGGGAGGIESLCRDYAKFSTLDNVFIFLWQGGYNANEIKKCGCAVYELNASKKDIIGTWRRIKKICEKETAEVAVAHHADPIAHLFLIALKRYFPEIKTVAYAHGNAVVMCHVQKIGRQFCKKNIIKKSLVMADKVIAISQSVKDSLISYFGLKYDKIFIIYNGVNIDRFVPNISKKDLKAKLIYVGRLIEEKGVQVTIKALSLLPKELEYSFSIVGDGSYRGELEKLTKDLGLEKKVTFLGERYDIPELLSEADIFVHMPVCEEGFGITVVEAMAAGLVCICADSGATTEIITNSSNGYIIEKEDAQALAKMLKLIVENINSEKISKVKENAALEAKRFSVQNFTKKLDDNLLK